MTPTKRCDLCDTVLEFEQDGVLLAFTAHTPELCRLATKQRIEILRAVANAHRDLAELERNRHALQVERMRRAVADRIGDMFADRANEERNGRPRRAPWR